MELNWIHTRSLLHSGLILRSPLSITLNRSERLDAHYCHRLLFFHSNENFAKTFATGNKYQIRSRGTRIYPSASQNRWKRNHRWLDSTCRISRECDSFSDCRNLGKLPFCWLHESHVGIDKQLVDNCPYTTSKCCHAC